MSSFNIHMNAHKGFIKSYWAKREKFCWNHRMSPEQPKFQRTCGRHKNVRYMMGSRFKQFDISCISIIKNYKSRTSIPYQHQFDNQIFRFGKSFNKKMGFNTKFNY